MQGLCALHRKPFSPDLAQQQLAAPYTAGSFVRAADAYGFDASLRKCKADRLHKESFPLIAWLSAKPPAVQAEQEASQATTDVSDAKFTDESSKPNAAPALILQADAINVLVIEPDDATPSTIALAELSLRYRGHITRIAPKAVPGADPDSEEEARQSRKFGFSWFVPELLKHKKLWQEVLLASLVIQLIALATPLFTQAIIDKVVVHHTQSTLIVIALGMAVFMLFSAGISWLRQYLVLHTGNRVDAVLGSSVFERLFKLPPLYFQHRPTGVIEQVPFKDWYLSVNNHSVANLQVVIEGTTDYNAASPIQLNNKKIEQFNFDGLVTAFDQARLANPSLTSWGLSSSLLNFYLSGSDTAAIGGDLAYQYAKNGNLSNISMTPAQALLSNASFGTASQNLQSTAGLQDLSPRLV